MKYGDGDIISRRIRIQATRGHSIDRDVKIDGFTYSFEQREFSLGFSMVMPKSFDNMRPEYAKRKYPHESRPEIIITNDLTDTDFAFDCDEYQIETLEERMYKYKAIIKRIYPSNVFISECIYSQNVETEIASYDFISFALDDDVYNLSFFTDLPNSELFAWFTCRAELRDKWEPLVRQMIQTLKPLPQDEE